MWRKLIELFRGWDNNLLAFSLLLVVVGLAELYSSSLSRPEAADFFIRQLFAFIIGMVALLVSALVDYRTYRSWSRLIYITSLALLAAVLIFGKTSRGTTGWFRFFGSSFQPIEIVKFMWVMALASYLAHVGQPLTWKKTLTAGLLLLPLFGLVMAQPDFGSAFLLLVIWGTLLISIPKPRRWWLVMAGLALTAGLLGMVFLKGYQRDRLFTFFNPQADPLGKGYNVTQSVVAVGAGGWWGRGLGLGTQSQLKFLPEQHTDFIFASIAEELGFLGIIIVLALWVGFFARIIRLIRRLRDDFAVLVAIGIFSIFGIQVALNIGMNVGLAPVVGLTLPFLSFGGSSLVASLAAVGVLQNLARHYSKQAPYEVVK